MQGPNSTFSFIAGPIFLALFAILATVNTHVRHAQPRDV
jgi:hypothetical protein